MSPPANRSTALLCPTLSGVLLPLGCCTIFAFTATPLSAKALPNPPELKALLQMPPSEGAPEPSLPSYFLSAETSPFYCACACPCAQAAQGAAESYAATPARRAEQPDAGHTTGAEPAQVRSLVC